MKTKIKSLMSHAVASTMLLTVSLTSMAADYPNPVPLMDGAQASMQTIKSDNDNLRIAYMPPATEFAYYIAIGEGINQVAAEQGVDVFMLAPQSGADINGQMGMIQDVLTQDVDAIIFGTHDEFAAAPLLKKAVNKGIAVVMINSDIPNFPTPIHGVVGYAQRPGTQAIGQWLVDQVSGKELQVGVIEGQPGYHSTERVGGFLEGIEGNSNLDVVVSIDGKWNVEGGNTAAMDMLQSNPGLDVLFAANDYMAIGATYAAKALGRSDLLILGNDGDTSGLEAIAAGSMTATVNTAPVMMGQAALNVALDALRGDFAGGWVQTPTAVVAKDEALDLLKKPEFLHPKPAKKY